MQNFEEGYLQQEVISSTGSSSPYILEPPGDSRSQAMVEKPDGQLIKYLQLHGL
jgi:hypothetical protein